MSDGEERLRLLLVPGGGGSGPEHWHHRWAAADDRCEWVEQENWTGGSRDDWVGALDAKINESTAPVVLIAHSMACVVSAHWAQQCDGPVVGAMLVAPADVEGDWVQSGEVYEQFRPIPMESLSFPSVMAVSGNDPYLSLDRAREISQAWGSTLEPVGALGHIGSAAELDTWEQGRRILDEFVTSIA